MKNLMMGTAIALLASAGYASAQEWSVDVKGVFKGGFAFVDIEPVTAGQDFTNTGFVRDSEIHVIGELVADNGLTFGIRTEFETADSGDQIDENYGYVKGSFGRFEFGEADGAADWAKYAGDVGSPWSRSGDGVGILFDGAYYGGQTFNALDTYSADTSDDMKLSYYTPSFAGFSAGVSYVVSTNDNGRASNLRNANVTGSGDEVGSWELGAMYKGEFGGVSFDAGVGYTAFGGDVSAAGSDYAIGGSAALGYAGFKLGVSYGFTENGTSANSAANTVDQAEDASALGIGLSYATGPWTFGGDVAFHLDDVIVRDPSGTTAGDAVFGSQVGYSLGVAYALAPGVSVGLAGEYLESEVPNVDESFAIGTWIGMSF